MIEAIKRSFNHVLDLLEEITFRFDATFHAFLVEVVVDGFQVDQDRDGIRVDCVVIRRLREISVSHIFVFPARNRTYGGGDGRSRSQTRSFEDVLDPIPKVALGYDIAPCAFLITTVVDRLQLSQGRNWIETEWIVIRRLREFRVSAVHLRRR